jgi:hypothetical protein
MPDPEFNKGSVELMLPRSPCLNSLKPTYWQSIAAARDKKTGGGPADRGATTVEGEACRGIEESRGRGKGKRLYYLRCQWYGAISLSTLAGPHVPCSYGSTGGGDVSSGSETSQTRSMPSELVNSDMSPSIASRISRS